MAKFRYVNPSGYTVTCEYVAVNRFLDCATGKTRIVCTDCQTHAERREIADQPNVRANEVLPRDSDFAVPCSRCGRADTAAEQSAR